MSSAYSQDLRDRVIRAWLTKKFTWDEIAAQFSVGVATVDRWVSRYKATGSAAAKVYTRGPAPRITDENLQVIAKVLSAKPDLTLPELAAEYAALTSSRVSRATIGRAVARLGFTRKKKAWSRSSASVRRSNSSARNSPRRSRR